MRLHLVTLAVVLGFACSQLLAADTLTIVHVNDTHSNLAPGGRRSPALQGTVGGIARAATYIGMARATSANTLVLHAGDLSIGDLFYQKYFGVAELKLMSAMGFDAMALGNHEFDLTPATLYSALQAAFADGQTFAVLSANTILEDTSVAPLKNYVTSSMTKDVGSIKVGIFGLTTPETNLLSQPHPAVIDTNILEIAQTQVNELRSAGCNVVILLSHLGSGLDRLLTTYVSGIDLVVGGHDHSIITAENHAGTTPIAQAGAFYHTIGNIQLEISGGKVTLLHSRVDSLNESFPEEPTIAAMVGEMISEIEQLYGPVYTQQIAMATDDIEQLATDLDKQGTHDTPLGNLISDGFRAWGKTEIAIEPGGSVAQDLYRGPLVPVDAFRAISYGFNLNNGLGYRIARFSVLGAEIMQGIEFGLADLSNDEFLSQVSGMTYTYDPAKKPYERLVDVTVNGQPMDPTRRYSVTANEFVVMFFSVLGIIPEDVEVNTDTTEFMILAGHIMAMESISPSTDGRVRALIASSVEDERPTPSPFFVAESFGGYARLDFPVSEVGPVHIDIYNSELCRVAVQSSTFATENNFHLDIATDSLSSGTYILRVQIGDQVHVGRVIVLH